MTIHPALTHFHPRVAAWFAASYPAPTDAQAQAWPVIASGAHALITAPTGSGKTLTAFLWALDRLLTGHYAAGTTRVLYVSPLKALNTDIQRNLTTPLTELGAAFQAAGETMPRILAQTRSGDTTTSARSAMLRKPPEILITTPESLNLLLTSKSGRATLTGVQAVILDEIHDVVPTRRGVQLITAVERLAALAGEFQRIALSATVNPLEAVAAWVGGYRLAHHGGAVSYTARPVTIVRAKDEKHIDLRVALPADAEGAIAEGEKIWTPIAASLRTMIAQNRATLIFVNGRRLAEQITLRINEGQQEPIAYAHHGSLSREIRGAVEQRLKDGQLKAIVATSSLEMGIDIGELDEVAMLQSPPTIAATLQRTGRAGHQVGATSRGTLIPSHGHDFLAAAALTEAVKARDIEPLQAINGALDVLAQQLISMTAHDTWDIDALYAAVRCAAPYHALPREHFDLVMEMLAGRYASTRVRALNTRVSLDRAANTVHARKGAVLALYTAGGSIPNRGYFALRHSVTNASIGELDEEFVWEAVVGQVFAMGTRHWRIKQITHDDVFVEPTHTAPGTPPFWRAEGMYRSHHFSLRIGHLLQRFDNELEARGGAARLQARLINEFAFNTPAANQLTEYLERQRDSTQQALPHRQHLLIEHISSGPGGYVGPDRERQIALHTMWGGRVNRPFALAMSAAWAARWGETPKVHVENDTIVFECAEDMDGASLLSLIDSGNLEQWLRPALESSAFFGARFRECAGRALLLAPRRFNHRQPLWMTRRAAKDLLEAIADKPDFPILLEAWRACLVDEFELGALRARLDELGDRTVGWDECATNAPSPFTGQVRFNQISGPMYADDTPQIAGPTQLSDNLIRDSARHAVLRPHIEPGVVAAYEKRRLRLEQGWSPGESADLIDWVRERVWLTAEQWRELQACVQRDAGERARDVIATASVDLVWLLDAERRFVTTTDAALAIVALADQQLVLHRVVDGTRVEPRALRRADTRTVNELVLEAFAFFGPHTFAALTQWSPFSANALESALVALVATNKVVKGRLVATDTDDTYCTTSGVEALLRMQRAQRRSQIAPLALNHLPEFLARWQGFGGDVENALQHLCGYRHGASLLEGELLPARIPGYAPHQLDELLRDGRMIWYGAGIEEIACADPTNLPLLLAPANDAATSAAAIAFADPRARYDFFTLADAQSAPLVTFSKSLWHAAWSGQITTDDFAAVREGIARGFVLPEISDPAARAAPHGRFTTSRELRNGVRQRARGWPGSWRRLTPNIEPSVLRDDSLNSPSALDPIHAGSGTHAPTYATTYAPTYAKDAIDDLERSKDLARLLLARYGVVCRDLVAREAAPLQWKAVFRALRLMELSGEVTAGHFFTDLSAPQFADPAALRLLERTAGADNTTPVFFWCSALDPISPCGLVEAAALDDARASESNNRTDSSEFADNTLSTSCWSMPLPRRALGNHLAFRGAQLAVVSEARGKRLRIALSPNDPDLGACLAPLEHLLNRASSRSERIDIETINGASATTSPYLATLRQVFDVLVDHRLVTLRRRFS